VHRLAGIDNSPISGLRAALTEDCWLRGSNGKLPAAILRPQSTLEGERRAHSRNCGVGMAKGATQMARYYTDGQEDEMRGWLLELREIVNPNDFMPHRDRASELVGRLDQCNFERTSTMDDEFQRVRRIWDRMETEAWETDQRAETTSRLAGNPQASVNRRRGF
jgi:hypothetical protein